MPISRALGKLLPSPAASAVWAATSKAYNISVATKAFALSKQLAHVRPPLAMRSLSVPSAERERAPLPHRPLKSRVRPRRHPPLLLAQPLSSPRNPRSRSPPHPDARRPVAWGGSCPLVPRFDDAYWRAEALGWEEDVTEPQDQGERHKAKKQIKLIRKQRTAVLQS
ncbi:hypothetical protein T492DRAFT_1008610 [Pavlovales sp. CCMP2436]|nr:hypothetical protein T492DRAFT_1008610 [Pavlovales sp. CCMP2436]|mmetsp:Transcript_20403/g.51840  ORF Transcript_20403/g.51840 Transcript_20403/m.51840 type:complete len:167 (-) Transcript_20403:408-908(-)